MNRNIHNGDTLGYTGLTAIGQKIYKSEQSSGEYLDNETGHKKTLTYAAIPHTPNWYLCITMTNEDVGENMVVLLNGVLLSTLALLLITAYITYFHSSRLVNPIIQLTDAVKHSERMDFTTLNYKAGNDEIGHLVLHSLRNLIIRQQMPLLRKLISTCIK